MLIIRLLVGVSALVIVSSCAPGGGGAGAASGQMGDLGTDTNAVGGISEVPNPSRAMVAASGTPLERLQHGHATYMLKCAECHEYMIPEHLFEDEWEDALPKMIKHAGLQQADEDAVLAYVLGVKKLEGSE